MMTIQEMKTGYEEEVAYQKHMLKNLGYWIQLGTVTSGIGIVISYLYHQNLWLYILGISLFILGALLTITFSYVGWKGQQNIRAVVDDYDQKIKYFQHKVCQQTKVAPKVK